MQASGSGLRIFFIGDIVGSAGRRAVAALVPQIRDEYQVGLTVANAENAAHGFGLTPSTAKEIFDSGVDAITGGNHIFDKKEVAEAFRAFEGKIVRPANYPPDSPGHGSTVVESSCGQAVGLINVMGRVFMDPLDCPFRAFERERAELSQKARVILLDIHAEATSEKAAMGYFVDGRVSACVGTHTHVQTSDERILPHGTGFLSDAGMTGPIDSIIGMQKEAILQRFLEKRPAKMQVAEGRSSLQGVIFEIDPDSGRCLSIQRIRRTHEQ
ncbi:MAG: TIGR00282 family metallophosphoesterase [Bradymonadales bacterium]|nr:MAG: TIGR00282 family metallophosphoesterase [Bradymonadales bacterium]